ncbi:RNA polymerase subunit sigma-70 [Burkholderiales bacterium 8X]|nr:RNA polymerase subunit sigma-70 [Burkholderiales bacterium 8X]
MNADELDSIAGEYVLGTLSAEARRKVEVDSQSDPSLRAAIEAWEARLLPLTALAAPAEPSADLWKRIEHSVESSAASAPSVHSASASGAATSAKASAFQPLSRSPSTSASPSRRWFDSLGFWRGLSAAGFVAAAIMATVLVTRLGAPPSPQYMVVLVAPQDKAPGWVVQAASASSQQLSLIPLGTTAVPGDKSLQFWTKADRWQGPVSLGLVRPGQALRVPIDRLPPLENNQLFELTLEPKDGSPIDRPTGPIQYIGRAVKVL